jgi:hypothetical protein
MKKNSYCGNHIAMRDDVSNMKIYVVMRPYLNGGSRELIWIIVFFLKKIHHMSITYVYCHAISSQLLC